MRERSRSPPPPPPRHVSPPPPPPSPPPKTPSTSYLALAKQTPARVDDPTRLRKLLVLDLNGTLLHRSPNNPRARHHERPRDPLGNLLPRLRPVHPRPYMSAFRSFLFAPETKSWLDVMVWSSAQPHSVDDMVDKCFGKDRDKMIAIWARDTLGLSTEHYFQKVQTVKDLEKPWSLLSSRATGDVPSSPHSSIASTPLSSSEPSSPSRPSDGSIRTPLDTISPQAHSALTTLLLDDSPRKAEVQPFNHVCIREYTGKQRTKDLESLQKEQDWIAAIEVWRELDELKANGDATEVNASSSAVDDAPPSPDGINASPEGRPRADSDVSKKRKRKEKKLQKRVALLEQFGDSGKPEVAYDETLLAVMGVLDEIKTQENVAAWIRSGGLWGPHGPPASRSSKLTVVGDGDHSNVATADVDERSTLQTDDSDLSVENNAISTSDGKTRKRKKRQRIRGPSADAEEVAVVGNDEDTAVPVSSLLEQGSVVEPTADEQKMWFEDPEVLSYWVTRGRWALEELGIPVEHGIDR
ncbi:hypothetical protein L227DRAFT_585891 [Lentinus tigrinus ALCF2SS1-6]|uniref:Mitochondrial import inner membrane translocase subunit TIM50 n=1 Tax=Lentinus tigrinus ALCF2SS1-6 TaxID=1328759 RepID=A0A5C2SC91_9APHY|nr:hypothetical protein L227DRAFT_585891 [Lentinus tigrinus ALCF2SS1-6]